VSVNLAARGYRVKEFDSGSQAVADLKIDAPDLVILDIMMPDPDGLEITRQIRQISQVPIMILSVRGETADKLTALDMGADDYITKPFGIEELLTRTRAILRRIAPAAKEEFIPSTWNYRSGGLFVDLDGLRVISHDCGKQLTPREWALLRVFIKYAGRVVAPRTLLQEAWGPDYGDEGDSVRTYVNRLRRKIEPEPRQPRYLLLERGLGYRLVETT
jgi:two-component system KDP operon response regulator KdpE